MRGFRQACLHFPRSVSDVANLYRILEIPRAPSTVTTLDLMWIFTVNDQYANLKRNFWDQLAHRPQERSAIPSNVCTSSSLAGARRFNVQSQSQRRLICVVPTDLGGRC